MPNVRCAVCKRLHRLQNKQRRYILAYNRFVCSWLCVTKWVKRQIPLDGKYDPQQMWGAHPVNHGVNQEFKSDLERLFAGALDLEGIEWQYEKWMFDVGEGGHYTPDFWLPKYGSLVEVKGMWWTAKRRKFDRFIEQYPKVPILLFNWLLKEEVEDLIAKSRIASWKNKKVM